MVRPIVNLLAIIGLLGMIVQLAPSRAHLSERCLPIADVQSSTRS